MHAIDPFQTFGLLICAAAFGWIAVQVAHGLQQLHSNQQQFRLNQKLLERQIASTVVAAPKPLMGWDGYRKFRVKWKVKESTNCHSLYLIPHDGKRLPQFLPGQYLTLRVRINGESKPLVRCYSLSDTARDDFYRVTVKTTFDANGNPGRVSSYLNEVVQEGDILDVACPKGRFCLRPHESGPVVLIAGGIGVTPVYSMLSALIADSAQRPVFFFYGVRNGREHTYRQTLQELVQENSNIQSTVCYSQPDSIDTIGKDFDVAGRVTIDLVKKRLPSSNFEFYLCGPAGLLSSMTTELRAWNVPSASIHVESFGPSGTRSLPSAGPAPAFDVQFARSGKQAVWTGEHANLLELAEANDISIESGCRTGSCGTCITAIRKGDVRHSDRPGITVDRGTCLACIAIPDGPVEIDA